MMKKVYIRTYENNIVAIFMYSVSIRWCRLSNHEIVVLYSYRYWSWSCKKHSSQSQPSIPPRSVNVYQLINTKTTRCSAIAERQRCRVHY